MKHQSIVHYLQHHAQAIDRHLSTLFDGITFHPQLKEAMLYSLHAGGKRLRPILTIAAAEAAGGSSENVLTVACAVEMVHTYSLIHDDLPAMDDDSYRRGKKTNHIVYGEAMAILAGDALLTHAFHVISEAGMTEDVHAAIYMRIINELSFYAGANGMVGGQAADMEGLHGKNDLEQLRTIHTHKTGDLIVFSLRAGGWLSGANADQLRALESYGYHIGLAFQIQDDILDVIGDEMKLGKATNSDEKANKMTYPHVIGLEESRRMMIDSTEAAKAEILRANFAKPDVLIELADFLLTRDY